MSSKCALIFVLVALCCLVATEAAAQRRNVAIEESRETKDNTDVDTKRTDLDEEERAQETANNNELQLNQSHQTVASIQDNTKATALRTNKADGRARRVIRRRRRGPRRNRNGRRRRGGNRHGGNRRRRGGRRNNRRTIRRRGGRPLRG